MFFFAAAIAIHIDLASLFTRHHEGKTPPPVTCGITTVSHKFVGTPGAAFRYDGDRYQVPPTGWIEMIAVKGVSTYEVSGRALPLNVWPRDEFGTETVQLPSQF